MYRTLLLLLYGTGMRIGEALRLNLQDLDLVDRVITVRCAKFFKTRLVPIGQKLTGELTSHIERRGLLPMPHGKASPLFASRGIRGWSYPRVITMFQHVRRAAGIENARSANRALRGYMIFATRRPCTASLRGIAPAKTSRDCCRSSRLTLVTSISDRPSVTSK